MVFFKKKIIVGLYQNIATMIKINTKKEGLSLVAGSKYHSTQR